MGVKDGTAVDDGNVVDENGDVSLLGVTIVRFAMSSRVDLSVIAMNVMASVVDRSSGRPTTVIRPAAVSTCVVIEIAGSSVESVTFAVAVDSVDVRIFKPVPLKVRNN